MQSLITAAGRLLFPQENACHLCQRFLDAGGVLCAQCERDLRKAQLSENCREMLLRPLSSAQSAFAYEATAKQMVLRLKYHSDGAMAVPLGESMCQILLENRPLYRRIDVVIPVPLHPVRQYERGYNQAQLLAEALCRPMRLPLRPEALVRTRATGSQVGRSRSQRLQALRRAFSVADPMLVQNRCILLVDDVLTTGATAVACAEALYRAGAGEVALITACRAGLRPAHGTQRLPYVKGAGPKGLRD